MLITTPGFSDLAPSIAKQLPKVVRMGMGTTVFRIRIEVIFRRCWNLITPHGRAGGPSAQCRAARFLCHVYNRMNDPSSHSYAPKRTFRKRGDTAKETEP
jgi:hypothetical protein